MLERTESGPGHPLTPPSEGEGEARAPFPTAGNKAESTIAAEPTRRRRGPLLHLPQGRRRRPATKQESKRVEGGLRWAYGHRPPHPAPPTSAGDPLARRRDSPRARLGLGGRRSLSRSKLPDPCCRDTPKFGWNNVSGAAPHLGQTGEARSPWARRCSCGYGPPEETVTSWPTLPKASSLRRRLYNF